MSISLEYKECKEDLLANEHYLLNKFIDTCGYTYLYYRFPPDRTSVVTLDKKVTLNTILKI